MLHSKNCLLLRNSNEILQQKKVADLLKCLDAFVELSVCVNIIVFSSPFQNGASRIKRESSRN